MFKPRTSTRQSFELNELACGHHSLQGRFPSTFKVSRATSCQDHRLVQCVPLPSWGPSHCVAQMSSEIWLVKLLESFRVLIWAGNMVRYGPNRLSINTNTALKEIYGVKANVKKSQFYSPWPLFFNTWSTQSMIEVEKYHHLQKRRILAQSLTATSLEAKEEIILSQVRTLCKSLIGEDSQPVSTNEKWSPVRDVKELISQAAFDIMGEVCFGHSFEMMSSSKNHYLFGIMKDGGRLLYMVRIGELHIDHHS